MIEAPTLRPYQEAATTAVVAAVSAGQNRLLVKKPTGTGKTVWFASLLKSLKPWLDPLPKRGAQLLVIAHREELLDQARNKIAAQNPGLMVDIEQGPRRASRYSDVVVAGVQTLAAMKFRRLQRLLLHHQFKIVIVDEAHHAAAASYRTTLAYLGFLPPADMTEKTDFEAATHDDVVVMQRALEGWDQVAPKDRLLVGVTATPNRSDAIGLGCVFQTIAYNYGLKQAIDEGWLVPIKPWVIETAENLDAVKTTAGDFNQKDLASTVNNERRNRLAVNAWKLYASDLATIAFTVDVQHAVDLCAMFQAEGINAKVISGETPKEERRQTLQQFTAGDVQVICNCMVLTEGTDLPIAACILHAKPTKSATLYEQMTGRGLRPLPGDPVGPARVAALAAGASFLKPQCVVLDVVDVARRHDLQTASVLYGLPPGINTKGDDLRKTARELEDLLGANGGFDLDKVLSGGVRMSVQELLDRASTFDPWSAGGLGAFGHGRALDWLKVGADRFRLQYPWSDGVEVLQVQKDMIGHWEVSATIIPKDKAQGRRQKTIAAGVATADEAAGMAEAFMLRERRSVMRIQDKSAPWRARPASEKQLALLTKFRIQHNPRKLTAGEASNLIDMHMVKRGRT